MRSVLTRTPPTDSDLALACSRGDQKAWESLVRRYASLVYSVAMRYGLDGRFAAEASEKAWNSILRELGAAARAEDKARWIATVASRECWNYIRELGTVATISTPGDDIPQQPLRDESVKELEQQYRIRQALRTLRRECQTLILGLYYRQPPKSHGEVAREAGIPEEDVGTHRAQCLWHLKEALDKDLREADVFSASSSPLDSE